MPVKLLISRFGSSGNCTETERFEEVDRARIFLPLCMCCCEEGNIPRLAPKHFSHLWISFAIL